MLSWLQVVDVRRGVREDGNPHSYAFVQFDSIDQATAACKLNGEAMMGRELFIDAATSGARPQERYGKPVDTCWFCLSSPQVDVNLVASVGEECYLALDKGPITPHHVLLVPIEHYPSQVGGRVVSGGGGSKVVNRVASLTDSCHFRKRSERSKYHDVSQGGITLLHALLGGVRGRGVSWQCLLYWLLLL